jgi:5-oxoprolinase (ATP-hydrolysing)
LEQARTDGFHSVAIVFLHSYTFGDHEVAVGELCRELGFKQVSVSSQLTPMIKIVQRGHTATVDAYLTPLIKKYIEGFVSGFDADFSKNVDVSFMMSDGGLCPMDHFNGYRSILSGPAGGVVGYARTSFDGTQPVIGIDMGGTSTDVSRFDGTFDHVFETQTAGVFIQAPQLAIETVAAGGGSRLFFSNGLFKVGPESAGAHPGPVCYRKNGHLAITDANVLLGRVVPEYFPKIFGPKEDQPLGKDAVVAVFAQLTEEVNGYYRSAHERDVAAGTRNSSDKPTQLTADEVAYGFVKVANEAMCRPIRSITEAKGFSVSDHVLSVFGGAGPQHACAIARNLGMRTVFVHRYCSILSAYGLGLADIVLEEQEPCAAVYTSDGVAEASNRLDKLAENVKSQLESRGFASDSIEVKKFLNLRYFGTDTQAMTERPNDGNYMTSFEANYKREYGFILQDRKVQIDDLRVRATGKSTSVSAVTWRRRESPGSPTVDSVTSVYFDDGGRQQTPVYLLSQLYVADVIRGPALIIDKTTTTVVVPGCTASITEFGDIRIDIGIAGDSRKVGIELDPIQLSVFAHRFMSIAEQMGTSLERTAVSTNIKERRDFSCAIFGPDGALVANAPHLPVHLGSMQEAVKWQINNAIDWKDGEVIASNHPAAGGSHLPDITVISPVYQDGKPVFYVASRGHHADIGGISPGSMPPFSTKLIEEGACFKSFKLVEGGLFQEAGITEVLMAPGKVHRERWETPSSGTRNLSDNISDLKAQIAANSKGISLIQELISQHGLGVVQAYMKYIQQTAEAAVRDMLRELSASQGMAEIDSVIAEDFMDNGAAVRLKLTINRRDGSAIFDFSGTDAEIHGNINAPTSVTKSAIIYSLRCMVKGDLPLNQGCLDPITIILPKGSFLDPSDEAAVVGGNVLTSQRVTDVILTAFKAVACSQGCMNNFTFGDETLGYYETIAGFVVLFVRRQWNRRSRFSLEAQGRALRGTVRTPFRFT